MATTYGQFCPVAMASEVLTERWTPLVVRELLCGSTRFNDLRRGVPLMSPALLSKRLKTLERVGVVDHVGGEYHLTAAGKELWPVIESMGVWGQRWARGDVIVKNYDASLLMWDIHRNVDVDALPEHRVVVHFHLQGSSDKKSHFWLVLESPDGGPVPDRPGARRRPRGRRARRDDDRLLDGATRPHRRGEGPATSPSPDRGRWCGRCRPGSPAACSRPCRCPRTRRLLPPETGPREHHAGSSRAAARR